MNLTPASLKTPRRKDSKHSTRVPHPNLSPPLRLRVFA